MRDVGPDAMSDGGRPMPGTETVLYLFAGAEYAGAVVEIDGSAQTLDEGGYGTWIVRPPLVGATMSISVALNGELESHTIDRLYWTSFRWEGAPPFDGVQLYYGRRIATGECDAYISSVWIGDWHSTGDYIGYDFHLCGAFAPTCDETREAIDAFVDAGKVCVADSDCMAVGAPCWEVEPCCSAYLNTAIDVARWQSLVAQVGTCTGRLTEYGCACSCSSPPPARCMDGRCAAAFP